MGIFIDPAALPSSGDGFCQLTFLLLTYGYILKNASQMISEGSELLLLVPSLAGVVGSVVLPVLGAVPDSAIIFFSGMGPNAQEELSVGVGALAGSTIFLLTIPWSMCIFGGRVHIDPVSALAMYKRPVGAPKAWSKIPVSLEGPKHQGVGISAAVRIASLIMLATSINYLLIQLPAFVYAGRDDTVAELARDEKPWALVGLLTSLLSFALYLVYQFRHAGSDEVKNDKIAEIALKNIGAGKISLLGALGPEFEATLREHHAMQQAAATAAALPEQQLYGSLSRGDDRTDIYPLKPQTQERLRMILRPFFHKYDGDKTGTICMAEMAQLFSDIGEPLDGEECKTLMTKYDQDRSGHLDFDEFVDLVVDHASKVLHEGHHHERRPSLPVVRTEGGEGAEGGEEHTVGEEEEEEEMPEDLRDLPWEKQQFWLKLRSFYMMFVGTALILVFADPMVAVLSELGNRTGIPNFYISFVLSPLISNGAEALAAYVYSQKKTSKTITIALATLLGASIMNATFVLSVFLLLIYARGLAWTFSAETLAILFVQVLVGLFALTRTQSLVTAGFILSLYPLSLVLVYVLQNVLGFD